MEEAQIRANIKMVIAVIKNDIKNLKINDDLKAKKEICLNEGKIRGLKIALEFLKQERKQ